MFLCSQPISSGTFFKFQTTFSPHLFRKLSMKICVSNRYENYHYSSIIWLLSIEQYLFNSGRIWPQRVCMTRAWLSLVSLVSSLPIWQEIFPRISSIWWVEWQFVEDELIVIFTTRMLDLSSILMRFLLYFSTWKDDLKRRVIILGMTQIY